MHYNILGNVRIFIIVWQANHTDDMVTSLGCLWITQEVKYRTLLVFGKAHKTNDWLSEEAKANPLMEHCAALNLRPNHWSGEINR